MDRNEFFVSLCAAVNRRDGIKGQTWASDLAEPGWRRDLTSGYDVALAVNSVHWFDLPGAARLFGRRLRVASLGWRFLC